MVEKCCIFYIVSVLSFIVKIVYLLSLVYFPSPVSENDGSCLLGILTHDQII